MLGAPRGGQTDAMRVDMDIADTTAEQRGIIVVLMVIVFSAPAVVVQSPAGVEMIHERHHQWNLLSEVVEVKVMAVPDRLN